MNTGPNGFALHDRRRRVDDTYRPDSELAARLPDVDIVDALDAIDRCEFFPQLGRIDRTPFEENRRAFTEHLPG